MRLARRILGVAVGVVVLGFALVGVLQTFRGTPISDVESVGGRSARIATGGADFRRTMELFTGTALHPGNSVELLLNGDETYPRLWNDLRAARSSITLRLYYAEPGRVADTLRAVLSERARAGVQVRFLFDAVGSTLDEEYVESLRAAGVRVQPFRPVRWYSLNRAQNRSHVRAVVIDGRIGYTGGFGIADAWLGGGRRPGEWRETNVRFTGPAVQQLQISFAVGWAEATGVLLTGPLFFPPGGSAAGPHLAAVLYAVPMMGSTAAERFLALSILAARRTLYITNSYFVPDDDLRRLLRDAARRGVDVRILTAGRHTDVPSARFAGRAGYEELLEAGVRIFEYSPSMLHAKTLVADGVWSSVGTMNFDNRSTALNEESNLLMYDRPMGASLDSIFVADLRFAEEIRLERFRRRSWLERFREWQSGLLTRLL